MSKLKVPKAQFIRFDRGISQFNHDYYAALGLPITSNPQYIRNVYLRIARILHPDVYGFSAEEKEVATQYLAKLVNPAYNGLMKEQDRQAYQWIFKLLAKRLMQRSRNIQIHSQMACELLMTPSDDIYEQLLTEIAKVQYQSLQHILDYTAEISELNLVYILCKEGYQHGAVNMPPVLVPMLPPKTTKSRAKNFLPPPSKPSYAYNLQYVSSNSQVQSDDTLIQTRVESNHLQTIDNRIKACEVYILQRSWQLALQDLREILLVDSKNSRCLALLGLVYKNINQPAMAKAGFKRSLQINPQEALALKHLLESNQSNPHQAIGKQNSATPKKGTAQVKRNWLLKVFEWISDRK